MISLPELDPWLHSPRGVVLVRAMLEHPTGAGRFEHIAAALNQAGHGPVDAEQCRSVGEAMATHAFDVLFGDVDPQNPIAPLLLRLFYEHLAHSSAGHDDAWGFLNLGYVEPDGAPLELADADEPHRASIALYRRVCAGHLRGDVLEVGCGRGGGTDWLMRTFAPDSITGADITAANIAACARWERAGVRFVRADAAALPFDDECFDAVVNVESSHCYPDVPAFLAEVARVLRPGGVLALCDFRPTGEVATLDEQLAATGLARREAADLTAGVIASLSGGDQERRARIAATLPPSLHGPAARFASLRRTPGYERFRRGEFRYVLRVCTL